MTYAHDRRRRAGAQRPRKGSNGGMVVVGITAAVVIGLVLWGQMSSEPEVPEGPKEPTVDVEPQARALHEAWNTEGLPAVMRHVAPHKKSRLDRLMMRVADRRSWNTSNLPRVSDMRLERYSAWHVLSWHTIEGYGSLRVSWQWEDDQWAVTKFKLTKD